MMAMCYDHEPCYYDLHQLCTSTYPRALYQATVAYMLKPSEDLRKVAVNLHSSTVASAAILKSTVWPQDLRH